MPSLGVEAIPVKLLLELLDDLLEAVSLCFHLLVSGCQPLLSRCHLLLCLLFLHHPSSGAKCCMLGQQASKQGRVGWRFALLLSQLNHVVGDRIMLLCTPLLSPAKLSLSLNQAVTTLNIDTDMA